MVFFLISKCRKGHEATFKRGQDMAENELDEEEIA